MHQPFVHSNYDRVSVVIPTYNSSKFLAAAIESVITQTYASVEIIVVDDGSTDDTKAVCNRYPTIRYIYQSNQGVSSARNTGMYASKSKYLTFLDSDDCLFPEAIEIGIECINTYPTAGFVFGSYLFRVINLDGSYTTQKLFDEPPSVASYETILAGQHKIQCATVLFRRVAIEAVDGFDSSFIPIEDLNLFLRVARTYPIHFHDRIVSEYRYHGGNVSSQSAKMLVVTLNVYDAEWDYLHKTKNLAALTAYECGRADTIKFFGDRLLYEIMRCLQSKNWVAALGNLRLIVHNDPQIELIDQEVYAAARSALFGYLGELPFESELAYWAHQLDGGSGLLPPQVNQPRLEQQTFANSSTSFKLDRALVDEIKLFSQQQGVTVANMLLATFKTLLYRDTGTPLKPTALPTGVTVACWPTVIRARSFSPRRASSSISPPFAMRNNMPDPPLTIWPGSTLRSRIRPAAGARMSSRELLASDC